VSNALCRRPALPWTSLVPVTFMSAFVRISNGDLWVIPADKLQEAKRLDPGLRQVDRRGF